MRRSVVLLVGVAGLLGSSLTAMADPATATAPAATTAPAAAAAPADDPNEIICKTLAPETGTRLGARRECQTRHDWDMQHEEAERQLQYQQQMGLQAGSATH